MRRDVLVLLPIIPFLTVLGFTRGGGVTLEAPRILRNQLSVPQPPRKVSLYCNSIEMAYQ